MPDPAVGAGRAEQAARAPMHEQRADGEQHEPRQVEAVKTGLADHGEALTGAEGTGERTGKRRGLASGNRLRRKPTIAAIALRSPVRGACPRVKVAASASSISPSNAAGLEADGWRTRSRNRRVSPRIKEVMAVGGSSPRARCKVTMSAPIRRSRKAPSAALYRADSS